MRKAILLLLLCAGFPVVTVTGAADMVAAIRAYQAGDYAGSVLLFREVIADGGLQAQHPDAYLLVARASINLGDWAEAERNLDHHLISFPDHRSHVEAAYLTGRLLYLQGRYEDAVVALQRFLGQYAESPFAANALYWAGESLFSLGRLDESMVLFRTVVERFPNAAKAEAARYKSDLVQLYKRERELLALLKLSHREALKAIEEYQRREQTYEQAIAGYQRRLAGEGSDAERRTVELEQKLAQADKELQSLRAQVQTLGNTPAAADVGTTGGDDGRAAARNTELITRLLAAKEDALALKAELVDRLLKGGL